MAVSKDFDFLVIGGGVAGLSFALEAAAHGSVAVLSKQGKHDSSTSYAQGGIAAVQSVEDSLDFHINDTLIAGAGLCNKEIVELVVREGPTRVAQLVSRGAKFDHYQGGNGYDLHKEGGHSKRRILHAADATGWEIQRTLTDAADSCPQIKFFTDSSAVDIVTDAKLGKTSSHEPTALGAYVLGSDGKVRSISAKKILVATGGAGKVYRYTSNPDVASGDGIAMCYRAGVPVANMEFYQFHPTCLFHREAKSFLISEALRGESATLHRLNGERFMDKYDSRAELAPRDIVARAIDNEMKLSGDDYVLLDISHKDAGFVRAHFPTIYERCLSFGIDITAEPIPVVPAAHYCCGGVVSDEWGRTSVKNLYVAGEVSCTGLHGANRLASNSLLEGLVFGYRAAEEAIRTLGESVPAMSIPNWDSGDAAPSDEEVLISQNWDEIRHFMWNFVGIVRSDKRLERALRRSQMIEQEIQDYYWNFLLTADLLELRNLSLVANLVIRSAMARKESRGLHFTVDYPETKAACAVDTVLHAGS